MIFLSNMSQFNHMTELWILVPYQNYIESPKSRSYIEVWYCLFCHFDPSISNVHNLVMVLSQTKCDDKIMIYIEFCVRKIKFLECLIFRGWSPKISTFSGSDSKRLERGPQCSAHRRNFQKPSRTFIDLRIGYNPTERTDTSSQYRRCDVQKNKKTAVFAKLRVFLGLSSRASRFLGGGVISLQDPTAHTQNSNNT